MCQQSNGESGGKLRDRFQLDSCLIRVDPQLAVAFEHIRHPQNLITQLGLDIDFNEDGLVIAGMSFTPFTPTVSWVLPLRSRIDHFGVHYFSDRTTWHRDYTGVSTLDITTLCYIYHFIQRGSDEHGYNQSSHPGVKLNDALDYRTDGILTLTLVR